MGYFKIDPSRYWAKIHPGKTKNYPKVLRSGSRKMPKKGRGRRTKKARKRIDTIRKKNGDGIFKSWGVMGGRPRGSRNKNTQSPVEVAGEK